MIRSAVASVALVMMLAGTPLSFAQDANQPDATDAAQSWLTLLDAGSYGESWAEATASFRKKVSRQQWEGVMQSTRAPLGNLDSRQFKNAKYQANSPHGPAGKSFVIQFETKFSASDPVLETVTTVQENDGQWKVSAYYIRPTG